MSVIASSSMLARRRAYAVPAATPRPMAKCRDALGSMSIALTPFAATMVQGPPMSRARRHPLCPLAHRLSAYRRRPHRAVQLALCAPARRQDAAADRGHRPRALDRGGHRRDHRRADLARPRLGRRDRLPVLARRPPSRVAEQLLAAGKAYRCYATPEELAEMREAARREGRSKLYDGRWRDRDPSEAPPGVKPVIRLKAPLTARP